MEHTEASVALKGDSDKTNNNGSSDQESKGSVKGTAKSKGKGSAEGGGRACEAGKGKAVYYGVDEARKKVGLKCTSCGMLGAVIGCHVSSCQVNTHYACAVKEGWEFGEPDAEGKVCMYVFRCEGVLRFRLRFFREDF